MLNTSIPISVPTVTVLSFCDFGSTVAKSQLNIEQKLGALYSIKMDSELTGSVWENIIQSTEWEIIKDIAQLQHLQADVLFKTVVLRSMCKQLH